jgi:hypothetical protein
MTTALQPLGRRASWKALRNHARKVRVLHLRGRASREEYAHGRGKEHDHATRDDRTRTDGRGHGEARELRRTGCIGGVIQVNGFLTKEMLRDHDHEASVIQGFVPGAADAK